jgi:hypothetical protein
MTRLTMFACFNLLAMLRFDPGRLTRLRGIFSLHLRRSQPINPWPLQVALNNTFAAKSRWNDFNFLRVLLREAKMAGDPLLAKSGGYVVETLSSYGSQFDVIEYPSTVGASYIRYRFVIVATDPNDVAPKLNQSLVGSYFDLEQSRKADDSSDQAKHVEAVNKNINFS